MVDLPGPGPVRRIAAAQQSQRAGTGPATSKTVANDVVNSEPQVVSLAKELASGSAPLDQSRIAQIRAAISSGTFTVDPEAIARALLGTK